MEIKNLETKKVEAKFVALEEPTAYDKRTKEYKSFERSQKELETELVSIAKKELEEIVSEAGLTLKGYSVIFPDDVEVDTQFVGTICGHANEPDIRCGFNVGRSRFGNYSAVKETVTEFLTKLNDSAEKERKYTADKNTGLEKMALLVSKVGTEHSRSHNEGFMDDGLVKLIEDKYTEKGKTSSFSDQLSVEFQSAGSELIGEVSLRIDDLSVDQAELIYETITALAGKLGLDKAKERV